MSSIALTGPVISSDTTGEEPSATHMRWATTLLGFCMFSTGASGLVNEYVLATVATYILGNSIEQYSVIIALMLFMMGIAGAVQKWLSDKFLVEKFIGVEIAMALLGSFAPIAIYAAYSYLPNHFNLALYAAISMIGFLIGFEIPLVMRINEKHGLALKTNVAVVWSMDYVGSFVGALVWVKVLLRHFPVTQISFIVAGFNFIVAAITIAYFLSRGVIRLRSAAIIAVGGTMLAMLLGFNSVMGWTVSMEQRLFEDKIIWSKTTTYQHLVITENQQLGDYRLYINGNTQFSSLDEVIYHEQLVHPVMRLVPDHRRVLILGGGDGLALREVLKYPDVEQVTLVDLDPEMVQIAKDHPVLSQLNKGSFSDARVTAVEPGGVINDGWRRVTIGTGEFNAEKQEMKQKVADVRVINLDADLFLSHTNGMYNVIIVDLPDPNSVELAKLYSKEFYGKLKKRLATTGMIVIQSTSPYHAREAYTCIGRTLEAAGLSALPYHDNVPSFGDWGWWLASPRPTAVMRNQAQEIDGFAVETEYLDAPTFHAALVFGKGQLQAKRSDVNTLMRPVLLQVYQHESWLVD